MRIIERLEGYYEAQDVQFGRVYRWCPESVLIEWACGRRSAYKRSTLIACVIACECLRENTADIRAELLVAQPPEEEKDEALHPWRYARGGEAGVGLPYSLLKGSGGRSLVTGVAHEEGTGKKAHSTSGFEARRCAKEEDAPLVEQRARWLGVLVSMLGATLIVLSVVLSAKPC